MKAFMYHYMRENSQDMPRAHYITPNRFEMHLKKTKAMSKSLIMDSLKTIRRDFKKGETSMDKKQGVIITFDDGIKDNVRAAEILEAEGSSGIFFLASMPYIEGEFLDVHMIHLIVYQENIDIVYNKFLELLKSRPAIENRFNKYKIRNEKNYNFYGDDDKRSDIKVFMNRYFPIEKKKNFLKELMSNLNIETKIQDFYLTKGEINKMEEMGMIIGAHSHSHNLLSRLTEKEQSNEINKCRQTIDRLTKEDLTMFSYPYGRRTSYNDTTINILNNSNFEYAFSVGENDLEDSENEYELARYNCNSIESIFFER